MLILLKNNVNYAQNKFNLEKYEKHKRKISGFFSFIVFFNANFTFVNSSIIPKRCIYDLKTATIKRVKNNTMKTQNRYRIGKTYISVTNPDDAQKRIEQAALSGQGGYVCVSNMRTVVCANKHNDYLAVMGNAFMCLPDGMPLVWMAKLWGLGNVQRTTGPDLFLSMLGTPENGIRHFLLGDTEETLSALKSRYSQSSIVGIYSPAFCEVDEFDYEDIARKIRASNTDVVWVALRAPKQDFFAARLFEYLPDKVLIGVGAAFRFALGEIKHPNKMVQKMGLTGLIWRKNKLGTLRNTIVRTMYLCKYGIGILWTRLLGRN